MAYVPLVPSPILAFGHLHNRCLLSYSKVHKTKHTTSLDTNLHIVKNLTNNLNDMRSVTDFIKRRKGNRNKSKVNIIRLDHR